ncbi:MAG TPA: hypothetical protein VNH42_06905 [Mariprofundaceae bacterium]|nr:hypothetical protein [Mariprofundaceae bacterium]
MDVQPFAELVDLIYGVTLDAEGWQRVLIGFAGFFGCISSAMRIVDTDDFHVLFEVASGATAEDVAHYAEHFAGVLPHLDMLKTASNHYAGDVFVVGESEVVRLDAADPLLDRLEQGSSVRGFVFKVGSRIVHIAMLCGRQQPGRLRFVETLPLLMPHLQRAFLITKRMTELKYRTASLEQTMNCLSSGVIMLDGNGAPVYMNRRAREIVSRMEGLHIVSGQLVGPTVQHTQRLRHMVGVAVEHGKRGGRQIEAMAIPSCNEESINLALVAVPLHVDMQAMASDDTTIHAALLIASPAFVSDLKPEVLQLLANLTGAEARLALGLAAGQTLGQYCKQSGIQIGTARGYLKQAFRKTGTNRQSELVSLLHSIALHL